MSLTSRRHPIRGRADGFIQIVPLKRSSVERLLPSGLEVAPDSPYATANVYPLIIFIGRQLDVRTHLGGVRFPRILGPEYLELVIVIPDLVATRGSRMRVGHAARMFLNARRATLAGALYAFNKRRVHFLRTASGYALSTLKGGAPLVSFEGRAMTDSVSFRAALDLVKPWFEQPLFQPSRIVDLCSRFDWHLDAATLSPAETRLTFESCFLDGLTPDTWSARGFEEAPFGAFRVQTTWTMSEPQAARIADPESRAVD